MKIEAKDLVAFGTIGAMVIFKLTGHDGTLDTALAVIVGYYFARRQDTQIQIPPALLTPAGTQTLSTPVEITEVKKDK